MHLAFRVATLAAATFLAACGGGGGDTAVSAPAPAPATTLTGVVAVGAPLAGAQLQSWCTNGSTGPVTTVGSGGIYELHMPAECRAPWILRATKDDKDLYSWGGDPDSLQQNLNVTTLTDTLTRLALQGIEKLGSDGQFPSGPINPEQVQAAFIRGLDLINETLPSNIVLPTVMPAFVAPFQPVSGDAMDDLLEALARVRGFVPLDALREQIDARGGDLASGQPWKTLFGESGTLALSGSSCTALGNPVAAVTATLRMDGGNLVADIAAADATGPAVLTIGPSFLSDFQMIVRGNDPYVRLSGSAGGNSLQVFTDAGGPKISVNAAGVGSRVCTLDTPVRRAALVGFQPAARILSVVPSTGASGTCAATTNRAAFSYAVSALGDVRIDGTSLPANWLDAAHAYYVESLQYGFAGSGPSYQVLLSPLATAQRIQPYYFRTVPYGVDCNPPAM